jgi:pyrroline-5-carboxylate reductase
MIDLPGRFWLIGCGNMAGAMLRRWIYVGMDPMKFLAVRPSGKWVAPDVHVVTAIPDEEPPTVALLGFKPHQLDDVAPLLAARLGPDTLLISILAGVEQATLRQKFPTVRNIARAMPNTPVLIGKGAIGLHSDRIEEPARGYLCSLMEPLGTLEWIEDEGDFDMIAALTASGPAFVFRFIDALARGAAALGLPADQARRLATATVEGAGALAATSGESPHQLAERVASPGGMTRQGLDVLDDDEALNQLVHRTLEAALRRSREMGEEARRGPPPPVPAGTGSR